MHYLLEILVHLAVWPSLFILCLAVFRLQIRDYINQIATGTLIMSQVAYVLQTYKLVYLVTIVQPIFFLLCLTIFFKFRPLQSTLMIVIVFVYDVFIEFGFNAIITGFNYKQFLLVSQNDYLIQGFVILTMNYLSALYLIKNRLGFSIISKYKHHSFVLPREKPNNYHLLILIGAIFLQVISYAVFFWTNFLVGVLAFAFIALATVLHFTYNRELLD